MQQKEAKLREKTKKNLKLSTQLTLNKHDLKKAVPNMKEVSSVVGSLSRKFEFSIGIGSQTP